MTSNVYKDSKGVRHIRDISNPDLALDIVNSAQSKKNTMEIVEDSSRAYEKCLAGSIGQSKIQYGKKEKKKPIIVQKALLYISIIALLVSVGTFAKVSTDYIANSVEKAAMYDAYKGFVDDKIDKYVKLMDHTGNAGQRIENAYNYNSDAKEAYVDYSPGILVDHITEAVNTSDIDTRCVILAAYKIINEPYRDEVFNKVFTSISNNEELKDKLPSYLNVSSLEEYIKALGYENIQDYQNNERESIYELLMKSRLTETEANVATMISSGEIDFGEDSTPSRGGR